jgi:predicted aspartyl protease
MFRTLGVIVAGITLGACASVAVAEDAHIARLDISHNKPFVMVTINGKGPFRFIVDTGTGGEAFITPSLAEQLDLPHVGQARLSDPSGKGSRRVPIVLLQSLQLAGVEFKGVKAAVHELSDSDGRCQGLLGFVLFREYLLTLDYPNRQLRLTSGELAPDGEQSVLPFRMPDNIPVVSLLVGGARVEAQIDSGGTGLSLPEEVASRMRFASDPASFSNSHSLSTRFEVKGATLSSDIQLGAYTFKNPFIEINPAFPLANFGSCPMKHFAITFDQKKNLIRFDSRQQTQHLSATPSPMRMQNTPQEAPPDHALVPVG